MREVPQAGARTRLLAALGRWDIRGQANPRLHLGVALTVQDGRHREIGHVAPRSWPRSKRSWCAASNARPKRRIAGYQPLYRIELVSICGRLGDCYEL